jgi:hypothetical protein
LNWRPTVVGGSQENGVVSRESEAFCFWIPGFAEDVA